MIPHSVSCGFCVLLYKSGIEEVLAVHELVKPTWDIDWPHRAYYGTLGVLILEHFEHRITGPTGHGLNAGRI